MFRETVGNREMLGQILRSTYMPQAVDEGILLFGPEVIRSCYALWTCIKGYSTVGLVQSLNSPFFLPHVGAEPKRVLFVRPVSAPMLGGKKENFRVWATVGLIVKNLNTWLCSAKF